MRLDENTMTSSQGSDLCNRGAEKGSVNVAKQIAEESGVRAHLSGCGGKESTRTEKAEGNALTVFTKKTCLTFEATDMFNLISESHNSRLNQKSHIPVSTSPFYVLYLG